MPRRLEKTRFALEEIKLFCSQNQPTPLVTSYFAQYLAVSFYSETEQIVRSVLEDRLSRIADRKVTCFIASGSGALLKRVKKTELNDLLIKFDCGQGDVLGQHVNEEDVQAYSSIITDRHRTSHGDGAGVTIGDVERALPCAERLFDAFEQLIA
jgi:hypothetical protein